jgi:hypothetical protein
MMTRRGEWRWTRVVVRGMRTHGLQVDALRLGAVGEVIGVGISASVLCDVRVSEQIVDNGYVCACVYTR